MDEFWRRQAIEAELMRGSVSVLEREDFWGETRFGTIVDHAVFHCRHTGGGRSSRRDSVDLAIQVRTGVAIRTRYQRPGGEILDSVWENLISLSSRGGPVMVSRRGESVVGALFGLDSDLWCKEL